MADITVSNNIQILPPLKGQINRAAKGGASYIPDYPGLTGSQLLSPQGKIAAAESASARGVHVSVTVIRNSGLMLYDSVNLALSARTEGATGDGQAPVRGAVVDIEA